MNSEKGKNILLGVLIVGLVAMTVAYAALSTTLTINGSVTVPTTTWDIHFANVSDATGTANTLGGTNEGRVATLGTLDSNSNNTTGVTFSGLEISLAKPGDWAQVNFDIVNAGTIDAKLGSFTKTIQKQGSQTESSEDTYDGITYTVTCGASRDSGVKPVALASAQELVKSTGTLQCKLYVHYDELTNNHEAGSDQTLNSSAKTFNLAAQWQYIQK